MIVEFGNHARHDAVDSHPAVTVFNIPDPNEADLEAQRVPYTHNPGALDINEFRQHRQESLDYRNGITQLPEHEAMLAVVNAWPSHSTQKPAWAKVIGTDFTPKGVAEDLENCLREFYQLDDEKPGDTEDRYWTRFGPPGESGPKLPDSHMIYTNDGRVLNNLNDGGGTTGVSGTGSAATATNFTASGWTTNQWAGYRLYVMQTATGPLLWTNVISNTATVATIDQWYSGNVGTGSAATTPSAGYYYMMADGGQVSSWFVGLQYLTFTPAVTDHALPNEYRVGTPASVAAGAGYLRKIATVSSTQGTASRNVVLSITYTGNANDIYPQTFYGIGVSTSAVAPSPTGTMKFETALNANATVNASGDQITVTETITGS